MLSAFMYRDLWMPGDGHLKIYPSQPTTPRGVPGSQIWAESISSSARDAHQGVMHCISKEPLSFPSFNTIIRPVFVVFIVAICIHEYDMELLQTCDPERIFECDPFISIG